MTDPLAPMRQRFRERAASDLARLRSLGDQPLVSEIQPLAHGVAGASGIFGFSELSRIALEIDDCCIAGRAPGPALLQALEDALDAAARSTSGP